MSRLKSGEIDFRDAILSSINGVLFKIYTKLNGDSVVKLADIGEINDEMLPFSGIKIENSEEKYVPYYAESSIIAKSTERGVLNLVVETRNKRKEAPARSVGKLLTHAQNTFDAIGYKLSGFFKPLCNIPKMITDQTALQFAMTFPGSFGIQLRSSYRADSPEFTLFEHTAAKLYSIFNATSEEFPDTLSGLDQVSIASISKLLVPLDEMNSGLYIEYFLPNKNIKRTTISTAESISEKLNIIKEIELSETQMQVSGKIDGIILSKKQFSIIDEHGINYIGHIQDSAMEAASVVKINSPCTALIKTSIKHSKSSDKIIEKHTLIDLKIIAADVEQDNSQNGN
ncbi:hypothetical protein H4684_003596 [Desulfomicrobium macestii]|uniref:Uncharacterized protein n=2 Tax=Desulfomicrobium macestii TaxID=90731 RepID=A0ABR9H886_9BACT|nr:hypothetical protein [Desulfomicrobium macestii]